MAWSEQARKAALEARRRRAKGQNRALARGFKEMDRLAALESPSSNWRDAARRIGQMSTRMTADDRAVAKTHEISRVRELAKLKRMNKRDRLKYYRKNKLSASHFENQMKKGH